MVGVKLKIKYMEKAFGQFKIFCSTATAHGFGYFFSEFGLLSRLFWAFVTVLMIILGGIVVGNLRFVIIIFLTLFLKLFYALYL